ncbi:hypothetical protein RIF29_19311 [Crotalaria pallida]|uniref:RNase H type-1 domain-containing protein n=1 Tax=Crotalaria pallida TaxID=3830 RepID=A0AAN9F0I2_CROPI
METHGTGLVYILLCRRIFKIWLIASGFWGLVTLWMSGVGPLKRMNCTLRLLLPCPEKIKFLLWLLLHDASPCNARRHRCGLTASPSCPRCDADYESGLHVVRDCPKSKDLWISFGIRDSNFFTKEAWCWIHKASMGDWSLQFFAIVWWAWRWRNMEVLGSEDWCLEQVRFRVQTLLADMRCCMPSSTQGGDGMNGFGGLLRDSFGRWLLGFTGCYSSSSVLLSELMALRNGLLLAWNAGYRLVRCEVNSLEAYRLVSMESPPAFHVFGAIICDIKSFLARDWDASLSHVLREVNGCADVLAKMGVASGVSLLLLEAPPVEITQALARDTAGHIFVRC